MTLTIDRLGDVNYWSPQRPALYAVRTTLPRPGGATRTVTTRIGFREAVFEAGGLFLNGSRLEIFGLNRHQIFPCLGMAAPARLQRRDALILKNDLNVTMIRCAGAAVDPSFRWFDPPATLANQAYAHAQAHAQAQANPRYARVLAWAGIDYYSAPNPVNPVAAAKNWGGPCARRACSTSSASPSRARPSTSRRSPRPTGR